MNRVFREDPLRNAMFARHGESSTAAAAALMTDGW
jgi:hypothetical protein